MTRQDGADTDQQAHSRAASATAALDAVEAALAEGDLHAARRALLEARVLAGPGERPRAEALEQRLAVLHQMEGPRAGYEAALARGDSLAARDHAVRAVGLATGEEAATWRARLEDIKARIRSEWRINEARLDVDATGPALADHAHLFESREQPLPLLADGGSTLVLVSSLERWVFLREVDVARQRLRRIGWLRTPEPLEDPLAQVDGNTIYLAGRSGKLLQLARAPLDVIGWLSLKPFMLPDRSVQDAYVLPGGRYLWAELKDPGEECGIAIIDMEKWRVCRRIHGSKNFDAVPGTNPAWMLTKSLGEQATIHDESGEEVDGFVLTDLAVTELLAHPDGKGLLGFVVGDGPDGLDDNGPLGLVEIRQGQVPSKPMVVAGTCHEAWANMAVALDRGLAWLLARVGGRTQLIAYQPGPDGVVEAWRREVPPATALVRDVESRHVAALAPAARGLNVALLGDSPPELAAVAVERLRLFELTPPFYSCAGVEASKEEGLLSVAAGVHHERGDLERWIEVRRRERRGDPGALADLISVFVRQVDTSHAERLLTSSLERFPAHPRLALCRADLAAVQARWSDVEQILADVDPAALPRRHACHLHHLRGMACVHAGDAQGAHRQWSAGALLSPDRRCVT